MTNKEYWNLIDRETFLAITWEVDFSQACSFRRMLINHKDLHFTQTLDKSNNAIFLKSLKTTSLGHFWDEPIPRKLTDRRKDGRKDWPKDGKTDTLFYRPLPAETGGPKKWWFFSPSSLHAFIPLNHNQTKSVSPQTANVSWLWRISLLTLRFRKCFSPLIKFMFHFSTDKFEQI